MNKLAMLLCIGMLIVPLAVNGQGEEKPCEQQHMGSDLCPYAAEDYPSSGVSPYAILFSYRLTDDLADMFNGTDGKISDFWTCWEADAEKYDYIELNNQYAGNSWERSEDGWNGREDAYMIVRSAWHESGLYMYFEVTDDQFVDQVVECLGEECVSEDPDAFKWANDAMDIYLDKNNTDAHKAAENLFINYNHNRITHSTVQLAYQFGSSSAADEFLLVKTLDDNTRPLQWLTFEQADAEWGGLVGETVVVNEIKKIQEWFIPWTEILDKQSPTPGSAGDRMAFTCGYNDADGGTSTYDALRWRNAADPTKRVPRPGGGPHVPTEGWGDIQFVDDALSEDEIGVIRPMQRNVLSSGRISSVEYFDMKGRMLGVLKANTDGALKNAGQISIPASNIVLERIKYTNGTTQTFSRITADQALIGR